MNIPVNWKTVCTALITAFIIGGAGDFADIMGIRAQVKENTKVNEKQDKELEQLKIQTKIITYNYCVKLRDDDPMKKACRKILTGVDE